MINNQRSVTMMAVLILVPVFFVAACVKSQQLTDGGKKVQYVENVAVIQDKLDDPKKCLFLAYVEVEAHVAIGLIESRMKAEQKQRLIRARNLAARSGGNVIIAAGEVREKAQRFKAYKCS